MSRRTSGWLAALQVAMATRAYRHGSPYQTPRSGGAQGLSRFLFSVWNRKHDEAFATVIRTSSGKFAKAEPMASPIHFIVHRNGEKWCVRSADLERSFADEAAARAAAVELADQSGKNGKPAIVVAELPDGALETIWTYEQGESSVVQANCLQAEVPSP